MPRPCHFCPPAAELAERLAALEGELRRAKRGEMKLQAMLYRLRKDVETGGGNLASFDNLRDVRSLQYDVDMLTEKCKVGQRRLRAGGRAGGVPSGQAWRGPHPEGPSKTHMHLTLHCHGAQRYARDAQQHEEDKRRLAAALSERGGNAAKGAATSSTAVAAAPLADKENMPYR